MQVVHELSKMHEEFDGISCIQEHAYAESLSPPLLAKATLNAWCDLKNLHNKRQPRGKVPQTSASMSAVNSRCDRSLRLEFIADMLARWSTNI